MGCKYCMLMYDFYQKVGNILYQKKLHNTWIGQRLLDIAVLPMVLVWGCKGKGCPDA